MYGLVNKAVEGLVVSQFGRPTWDRIRKRAGIEDEEFIGMETYPDDVTYRLVGAASEVLGLPPDKVLEAFGEYWTLYTAQEGYGEMFKAGGNSMREFLGNLNAMHGRVELIYPKTILPHFRCEDQADGSWWLHYQSSRQGLAPMVVGLIRGLAKMFGETIEIAQIADRTQGAPEDVFSIRRLA
ncbi:heme NO-binding domain-containing protein [Parachitinimonas caeni]|uniref:Heme NO-binding domain-containing protein n=1 Tax=Parachitinimonas caeni TaxID=3031301 RepID=A0ABT7DRT6_9NEIS|nr:heme NO-binding domain-containing protein [Parachitinimonas caeni]MDK2122779.1 heme NO-binding domain-containing protein [Parachitinimonas caeni]